MKSFLKIFFTVFIIVGCFTNSSTQEFKIPSYFREFLNIDSILWNTPEAVIFFPEVIIIPEKEFKNKIERMRYNRLVRNFLVVYPYTLEIGEIYKSIEDTLNMISDENLRRRYIRFREKQIMDTYKPVLRTMTLSQGILMVKLLDRETGSTAYEIVEELKGSVRAFFWQGFALLFGNNLKTNYDAEEKDYEIEQLVIRYKNGTL